MNKILGFVAIGALAVGAGVAVAQQDVPPPWAYGYTAPPPAPAPPAAVRDTVTKYTVPGSKASYTEAEANAQYAPPDWFPEDHPTMPDIVSRGRQAANVIACGLCHMPNGLGRPENANVTGLSREYFLQQLADFRDGKRVTSDPRKTNTATMSTIAKNMTDAEIKDAVDYFSKLSAKPWIKVVETDKVPKMRASGGMLIPLLGAEAGTEPIGQRVIETPVDADQTEKWRNSRSSFIAYAPPGSVKKGEVLATTGGGKFTACTACHGADLRGLGPVPTLAGRSPSYLVRQIYDMQHGKRTGTWTALMAPVIAKLTDDDVVNLAAYLASLTP